MDGYTYACRECISFIGKKNFEAGRERILLRQREYYQKNREKILARQSQYIKDGRKKYKPDPAKEVARYTLRYAVKKGTVQKLPCRVCGKHNSQGHHEDYTKPLDVTWLCQQHHSDRHRELRQQALKNRNL